MAYFMEALAQSRGFLLLPNGKIISFSSWKKQPEHIHTIGMQYPLNTDTILEP